ncbi:MAG: hypothetical protein KKD44_28020 [Proteobacteria bacterium]|nr:hypothetical protein [Pseudomonadota bacterium]
MSTYKIGAGYDSGLDALRVINVQSIADQYIGEILVEVVNGVDNTYYYYVDMDTFRSSGYQLILSGGSGTCTVTIEATWERDELPASCTYADVTFDITGATTITASDAVADNANKVATAKYVRFKVVASTGGANDADWTIYAGRLY